MGTERRDLEALLVKAAAERDVRSAGFVFGEIFPEVLYDLQLAGRRQVAGIAGPGLFPFPLDPEAERLHFPRRDFE